MIQPGKLAAIFSRTYTVHGAWKWCKRVVEFGLERKEKREKLGKESRTQQRMCAVWMQSMCVSISLLVCMCLCVRGPLNFSLSPILPLRRVERNNTKDTLSHKSTSPLSLSAPLGKVILSSKTFHLFSIFLSFSSSFPSLSVRQVSHSAIPTLSLCVCVLSSLVSLLWANLCQC